MKTDGRLPRLALKGTLGDALFQGSAPADARSARYWLTSELGLPR